MVARSVGPDGPREPPYTLGDVMSRLDDITRALGLLTRPTSARVTRVQEKEEAKPLNRYDTVSVDEALERNAFIQGKLTKWIEKRRASASQ